MILRGAPRGKVIPREFFGMHFASLTGWLGYTTPFPANLNVGSVRLWDTGTTWKRLETSKGVFDWSRLDAVMAVLETNGVSDIMFTLGQPPLWATSGIGPATGSFNPNPPSDIQDWRDYVTAIVTRYGSRIGAWEIWNEINLAQFWVGSLAQITELTQEASDIIRSIAPSATIIGCNTSSLDVQTSLPYMQQTYTFTDVDACHLYGIGVQPELKRPNIEYLRAAQRAVSVNRSIWNTEYTYDNYYIDGALQTGENNPMPEDMAAAYVARLLMMNWLFGFDRCFFYVYDNFGFNNIRLTTDDRTAFSKAGRTFAYISSVLTGGTLSSFQQATDHYEAAFTTVAGAFGKVFWCADDASASVDLSGYSSLTDVEGTELIPSASYAIDMSPVFAFR